MPIVAPTFLLCFCQSSVRQRVYRRDGCRRPTFQISPHASQRQYVDAVIGVLVVVTRGESHSGHFVGGSVGSPGVGRRSRNMFGLLTALT